MLFFFSFFRPSEEWLSPPDDLLSLTELTRVSRATHVVTVQAGGGKYL
jgi:hypothetical protein